MDYQGLKRILVPVDFSTISHKAYIFAKDLARNIGAEIHVLHVLDTHFLTGVGHCTGKCREEMFEKLSLFYRKREKNGFAVQLHLREGKPHEEILKAAAELEADLIAIGSHGWTGIERYMFGNIARKVLKNSDIPVLVIKSISEPPFLGHSAGKGGTIKSRKGVRKSN